ncbi:hypothetical protein GAY33_15920 [Azospirillum brasilense]|nr:hypothetical protein [Azospirillum argentinense]
MTRHANLRRQPLLCQGGAHRRRTFDNPRLPLFFDAMQLSGVSLGTACADVSFCRHGAQVAVSVLKRTGNLRIITAI